MPVELFPWNQTRYCPVCRGPFALEGQRSCRCQKCGFLLFFNVGAATSAIIKDRQGQLLFTVRAYDPGKGTLDLAGGFIEPDETAEEAIVREVREELNLELLDLRYFTSVSNRYLYEGVLYHTMDVIFLATADPQSQLRCADDVSDFIFLRPEQIALEKIGLDAARSAVELYLK
jgi:ADP-ribose pyrophosphatase YjhB (NUDIX family)